MDARTEILSRIAAVGIAPLKTPREAATDSMRSREAIVEQFAEYAADYKANVVRATFDGLPDTLANLLPLEGTVIPRDLPTSWLTDSIGVLPDENLSITELDGTRAVLTGCAIAIAETGTVVLDSGFAQGRRAITLVPDHHVCVVFAEQIVDSIPEAFRELRAAAEAGRAQTWISGPSATSDIELSRVEGVHGPRRLDIVIVG
ncbi:lactate utilization protein C [bacterium]|nr:MAG: lactate utilization protein C [bacterium]